jgi:hypothetical protein
MKQARLQARQATVWCKPQWPKRLSRIQRFGLAVISVSVTLGAALLLERFHFRDVEVPLFLFAVALAAWYAGPGFMDTFGPWNTGRCCLLEHVS